MRIFIIVPLDFKFSTLSTVGQQFEKKVGLLSTILGSLGHRVDRLFINADTTKLCTENRRKQLERELKPAPHASIIGVSETMVRSLPATSSVFVPAGSASATTSRWTPKRCCSVMM